ncbi:MAG: hypothetical protein E6K80_10705, partial [Candidatus Eisenbacteria bacterium]
MLALLAIAAACVVISASYRLYDTDLWHLLAIGRAIDASGLPRVDQWTWTSFGKPAFVSSWAFRALLWWLWAASGLWGLFAWRWITTLATFALLFATARRLGARGVSAVVILVLASLLERIRTDIRPETLASVLLALDLWILERDRTSARPTRALGWIPAIACAWANVHISWYLGFVLLGLYGLDARARGSRARAARLALVALAALAASLVNPYGLETLARPFRFALEWRNDPMFAAIDELKPLPWRAALAQGLFVWPILVLWRARRMGWDVVESGACLVFTALALVSNRSVASLALVAGPFVARDVQDLLVSRRWTRAAWPFSARAALAATACVALCGPSWARPELPLRVGFRGHSFPEKACDFMATHDVHGRGFNHFHLGGYLAYRFWGRPGRLPFMSTQPELASAEERRLYAAAFQQPEGWRAIQDRYRFDWMLLDREQLGGDQLLDFVDRDSEWVMVFSDDAAELLVRRDGASGALADRFGYRLIPAGRQGRRQLGELCEAHPRLRAAAEAELDRMIASSPENGAASHLRGAFALMDHDLLGARAR